MIIYSEAKVVSEKRTLKQGGKNVRKCTDYFVGYLDYYGNGWHSYSASDKHSAKN